MVLKNRGRVMHQLLHDPASTRARSRSETVLTLTDVARLSATPMGLESFSPLRDHNYLLLDISGAQAVQGWIGLEALVSQLRLLPCPVIGVGTTASSRLLHGLDVFVPDLPSVAAMTTNIDAHPLAAMTLVQLLRHNQEATSGQGLFAESLAYASLQQGVEHKQVMQSYNRATAVQSKIDRPIVIERNNDELSITLNRPNARNAYSTAMRDSLYEALLLLKADYSLHRAVIRGEGSCFSIGGDLSEFGQVSDPSTAHAVRSSQSVSQLLLEQSARLEFRLHSACIGAGIELPAFASRVIATQNTFMQLPEITLGLLPGAGGTVSILERIGRQRTAYLALSARRINAATALEWGLIDEII